MAEALRGFDMTTTKMRVLAVLSISSGLTVNELSVFAVNRAVDDEPYARFDGGAGLHPPPSPRGGGGGGGGGEGREGRPARARDLSSPKPAATPSTRSGRPCTRSSSDMFEGVDEGEYQALISTLHKVLANIRRHDL